MSGKPFSKKIKLPPRQGGEVVRDIISTKETPIVSKKEEKSSEKKFIGITPSAEIIAQKKGKNIEGELRKPLSEKGFTASLSASKGAVGGSGSYDTDQKILSLKGDYQTKKGGSISFTKDGKYYSASYVSPKGKYISVDSGKNINIDVPGKKRGGIGISASPQSVSGRYETKKGNIFSAKYDKDKKSFGVGASVKIKKKNK